MPTLFPYATAQAIFDEYRGTTAGRDLDVSGLTYECLEAAPQQWPFPAGAVSGTARLYTDGVFPTPSGRAAFANAAFLPVVEAANARHPFRLITGRLRDQWHGMSRTGRAAQLMGHAPEPRVTMNPADLARRGIAAGDLVRIASRRGAVTVEVESGEDVRPGQVFLPMHWGSAHLGGAGAHGINAVTLPALDPVSRQPELKHAAVRVTRAELPWRLVAFACAPHDDAVALAQAARALMPRFAFSTCVLTGSEVAGVLMRAAAAAAPDRATFDALDAVFGLDHATTLVYEDTRRGVGRRVRIEQGAIRAVRLAGDTTGEAWLRELFDSREVVSNLGVLLLAPGAPIEAKAPRGPLVCSCWNVSEREICDFLDKAAPEHRALDALQGALKCGTSCGSCLPELKRLVAARGKEGGQPNRKDASVSRSLRSPLR
jgi:assimilatory nitrate reductase catalytic subunit